MIRSQLWGSLTNNCHKGCNIAYLIRMVLVIVIPMTLPVKVKDILSYVNCALPSDLKIYSFGLKSRFVAKIKPKIGNKEGCRYCVIYIEDVDDVDDVDKVDDIDNDDKFEDIDDIYTIEDIDDVALCWIMLMTLITLTILKTLRMLMMLTT